MGKYDDALVVLAFGKILRQPLQLFIAQIGSWIGDVVKRDEVHALVVEGVVGWAEELLEGGAVVERRIVLAWHEMDVLYLQILDDVAKLAHALASLRRIVGGMGQVTGENDELRLIVKRVDLGHRLAQRALSIRIDGRPLKAPVRIRELDEIELVGIRIAIVLGSRESGQAGGKYHTAQTGQAHELPAIDIFHSQDFSSLIRWRTFSYTGRPFGIFHSHAALLRGIRSSVECSLRSAGLNAHRSPAELGCIDAGIVAGNAGSKWRAGQS